MSQVQITDEEAQQTFPILKIRDGASFDTDNPRFLPPHQHLTIALGDRISKIMIEQFHLESAEDEPIGPCVDWRLRGD